MESSQVRRYSDDKRRTDRRSVVDENGRKRKEIIRETRKKWLVDGVGHARVPGEVRTGEVGGGIIGIINGCGSPFVARPPSLHDPYVLLSLPLPETRLSTFPTNPTGQRTRGPHVSVMSWGSNVPQNWTATRRDRRAL